MGVVALRLSRGPGRKSSLQCGLKQLMALRAEEGMWLQKSCVSETCPVFASFPPHCISSVCILVLQDTDQKQHVHFILDNCETQFFSGGNQWQPSEKLWEPYYCPSRQFIFQWFLCCIAQGSRDSKSYQNISFHTNCGCGGGETLMGHLWVHRPRLWSIQVKWHGQFPKCVTFPLLQKSIRMFSAQMWQQGSVPSPPCRDRGPGPGCPIPEFRDLQMEGPRASLQWCCSLTS